MHDRNRTAALRAEIRELTARWQAEGRYTPGSDSWLRGFDLDFSRELAARRLIGTTWPVEHGGRGLRNVDRLAVTEELLRAGAPVAAHWVGDRQIGPSVLRHGSPELQAEILPGIISADLVFCLGMSEPDAGSDLASVRTFAAEVDGGWLVNGRKIWTTQAHRATHAYLLARTERAERKHDGLTEFIVDMDSPGISVSPIVDLAGDHHFNEVVFDDVFVPAHRVLGTVGNGWRQVVEQLSFERGGPERVLSTYPLLAELLAAAPAEITAEIGVLTARLATLRRLAWQVAGLLDQGAAPVQEAATLKYLGNAFEQDVIEVARRVLGGPDAGPDSSYGHALLASPGFTIRGGAADVLLSLIARQEATKGTASGPEDDRELRDLVAGIASSHIEPGPGELPGCWATLVELGLPSVGVAEEAGGSGGSVGDLVTVVGELGRRGIGSPLIAAATATWVLAHSASGGLSRANSSGSSSESSSSDGLGDSAGSFSLSNSDGLDASTSLSNSDGTDSSNSSGSSGGSDSPGSSGGLSSSEGSDSSGGLSNSGGSDSPDSPDGTDSPSGLSSSGGSDAPGSLSNSGGTGSPSGLRSSDGSDAPGSLSNSDGTDSPGSSGGLSSPGGSAVLPAGAGVRAIALAGPHTAFAGTLTVRLKAVPWARHAAELVVYRGDAAYLVDLTGPGVIIEPGMNVAGEPADTVILDGAAARPLQAAPTAATVRARLGLLWTAALAGAATGAYELTRAYVTTREQFGKPLVRLPTVATGLAAIKGALIQTGAALDRAGEAVRSAEATGGDPSDGDRHLAAVAAARIIAARGATDTARIAHQLHGAMGITAEYRLHPLSRRLWAWRDAETVEHDWAALLGELAIDGGEAVLWDDLTS